MGLRPAPSELAVNAPLLSWSATRRSAPGFSSCWKTLATPRGRRSRSRRCSICRTASSTRATPWPGCTYPWATIVTLTDKPPSLW